MTPFVFHCVQITLLSLESCLLILFSSFSDPFSFISLSCNLVLPVSPGY